MKKYIRVFFCILLLAVLISSLSMECYAAETDEQTESAEGVGNEVVLDRLSIIDMILRDSVSIGVKRIEERFDTSMVLLKDGTARVFMPIEDRYMCDKYRVTSWKNIRAIACSGNCCYGLTEEGCLVWQGVPYSDYSDTDYTKDEGWIKITSGKGYKDIACVGSSLFALRADGKIDVAFKSEESTYNTTARELCDEAEKLENITDIEDYSIYGLYVLNSSDEIKALRYSSNYGEANKTVICKGAVSLKVHDGAVCAVMNTGEYRIIDDPQETLITDDTDSIVCRWRPGDPNRLGRWLFRTEDGHMGRIMAVPLGQGVNFTEAVLGDEWCDVEDAYVFSFILPDSYITREIYDTETDPFRMAVILGIKENGECVADYHFFVSKYGLNIFTV